MSNNDKMTAKEQLFAELTSEQGANVSGGASENLILPRPFPKLHKYTFYNKTDDLIRFKLNDRINAKVPAGGEKSYYLTSSKATVSYDQIAGPCYSERTESTTPGEQGFDYNPAKPIVDLLTPDDVLPNLA